ncbi:Gfo/Idh/MocA family protein [Aquibacillus rhizosphaerae]|uniref:Gfo/Idh/MocA family oxidoreductase n=1 Tax=Aquibacillus rhizosphaerae TaxID=3051431 RepID=A0ABT7L057_9BACI|nr:Gfo/Idh/MocA family oxidoreductase [Aquibacillus sp. LR5S19]MDL4839201.1 Gfo/Idh/MocA family oxidoreductase [Aquibacillus sp. LR5S19]
MSKVNWGVLSTAMIGQEQVIPAIQRSSNGEVVAIASRGEKAISVAEKLDIPTAYTSYEELLADPNIDAVYIPLPNSLHKEWVLEAAKKGKHVLCEKTAGLDYDELKEMIDACVHHGVTFMEAFMYQFHPQHAKVKELITSGAIGDVSFMRASFSYLLTDESNIRLDRSLGGGALYDIGCYTIHSICNILNDQPTDVYANARIPEKFNVDTTVAGVLSFENDIQASFDCSFDVTPRQTYQVVGSQGTIEVVGPYRPDANESGEGFIRVVKSNGETEEYSVAGDQYKLQVEHFVDSVIEKKQPSYTNEKMLNHMKVMDAAFHSIETGKSIKLS